MLYLTLIFTLVLCLFFNPVYHNFTSLLSSSYAWLFYLWIFFIVAAFSKKSISFIQFQKERKYIYLLGFLFLTGCYFPYENTYIFFSYLHVFLPMLCIIIYFLFLFFIIYHYQKKEPIKAHLLYQWYFWGLSIISMLIIFFGQINGIIEIAVLIFFYIMLNKMQIIYDS